MITLATLFSGGEGVGLGAQSAGLDHLWGIEINDDIAQVARANGFNVITADILSVDPSTMARPDVLHASPECPNFSQAKAGAKESERDIAAARAVVGFIEALTPRIFTLENVWMYHRSESWSIIRRSLYECGYWLDVAHVNAADFGVNQTRKRMMVRAIHGEMVPYLPAPEPWRGWYEAIEDLIPALPESQLARWQLKRMPEALAETVLMSQGISRDHQGNEYPMVTRSIDEPAYTVTANSNMSGMRAFLVGGQLGRSSNGTGEPRPPQVARADQQSPTVTASNEGDWRALVVDPAIRKDNKPMFTVTAGNEGVPRVVVRGGKVVTATIRCLARWQTFPDWYEFPAHKGLAGRIIGNAVPPLQYQKIVAGLVDISSAT